MFDRALEIARELKPNIDTCMEYAEAYIFSSAEDSMSFGGDGPIVILKENGRAVIMEYFVENCDSTLIKEIKL